MLLHELVDQAADAVPEAPALFFGDRVISFAQLATRCRQVSAASATLVDAGGRLAMIGPNDPAWVAAYYGVPRAGRILLFLNHRLAPLELASILERSAAAAVIGPADLLGALRAVGAGEDRELVELGQWEAMVDAASPAQPPGGSSDEEPAWLLYTSGTTGRPKGAVLTHRSLLAGVSVSRVGRPILPDARQVLPFPLCHVAGYNVLCHHQARRPVILLPSFEVGGFVEATERWQGNSTTLTATMVAALLEELDQDPAVARRLASLRSVAYGAAPMPGALLRGIRRHLDVRLSQGYGMTELSGNAVFLGPEEHERGLADEAHLLQAAGRPGPGVDLKIVDDQLRELGQGEVGEIVVRGPQVMAGYWDDPEGTAATLVEGWLRTGDLGRIDDEGLLYVVDRKKDVIVTGGENVASREVEDTLLRCCPEVREAAVVGVPDPRWGENVCAVVVAAGHRQLDTAALRRAIRAELAGFKVPRHVVVVDELPKNATGKVQKAELRRWLAEHPELVGQRQA